MNVVLFTSRLNWVRRTPWGWWYERHWPSIGSMCRLCWRSGFPDIGPAVVQCLASTDDLALKILIKYSAASGLSSQKATHDEPVPRKCWASVVNGEPTSGEYLVCFFWAAKCILIMCYDIHQRLWYGIQMRAGICPTSTSKCSKFPSQPPNV